MGKGSCNTTAQGVSTTRLGNEMVIARVVAERAPASTPGRTGMMLCYIEELGGGLVRTRLPKAELAEIRRCSLRTWGRSVAIDMVPD